MAAATAVTIKGVRGLVVDSGHCTLDPGAIAAGANEDQTIAVPTAKVGDMVIVAPRAALTDGAIATNPHVSAAGTITFTIENHTGGEINLASGVWDWTLLRGRQGAAHAG